MSGYERVFTVLEHCDGATAMHDFKERLVEVLQTTYQVRYASFFTGSCLRAAFSDQRAVISGDSPAQHMYEEYQERWQPYDVYSTPAAINQLVHRRVAVLSALSDLSVESHSYVKEFLMPGGLAGSAAILLPLGNGSVGLVGLFGPDPARFVSEDARGLEMLAQRLSSVSRFLRPSEQMDVLDGIHGRQREVALLVGQGLTNADVGMRLHLAEDTVKKYVSRVLAATGCRTRTELALSIRTGVS
ncbi:LuxR C-terminal-related transcriptional regulator [Nocardia sp. R6R-6]|uniref:LuxR C-terminal-related transcriptional regulator n=1 Tax=Nocardia sp. R6R-6 TaxID=3459303 RepID=UPI00403E3587